MISILKRVTLFGFFLLLSACIKQEVNDSTVPELEIPLDYTVNSVFIPAVGQPYIINGQGHNANGIVLFNYGQNEFRAFDLTCPTDCLERMDIDASGIMTCNSDCNDEISFTQFVIKYTEGETTYYLKEYYATYQGGIVRISNN